MGREVSIHHLDEQKIAAGFYEFLRSTEIADVFKGFIAERTKDFASHYEFTHQQLS